MKAYTLPVFFTLFLCLASFSSSVQAQTKIGYTNVEIILNYMPETKDIEKKIADLTKKIEEQLAIKQRYFQVEYQTYIDKEQRNAWKDEAEKKSFQEKLQRLQLEIENGLSAGEQQLLQERMKLLTPLQTKVQEAIDAVAKEGGFTYIINNSGGDGLPTILYGVDSYDVTLKIAAKLNIKIPTATGEESNK